jgi:hypothetical protein
MTTLPDELTYERAAERIWRFTLAIGGVGTVAAFAGWGWRAALGFLTGAAVSGFNFVFLKGVVDGLAGRRRRSTVFLAGRYLLLGGGAYVIVKFIHVSLPAVLAGIFVLTAAVFVEVVLEIVYARK